MRHGFSLVELSIVLVILGLLTGGILAGQNLIRAAEIRNTATGLQRYTAAYYTFRDKYFAIPGDMATATKFWDVAAGTGNDETCRLSSSDTGTCDGDGNGQVQGVTTGAAGARYNERYRFWQHLARAGLIEGSYIGTSTSPASLLSVRDVNMPGSKVSSNAYWYPWWQADYAGSATNFANRASNAFYLTGTTSVMTPEECWNVDTKIDDGRPGTGKMLTYKGDVSTPVTTAAGIVPPGDANAEYNMQYKQPFCAPNIFFD